MATYSRYAARINNKVLLKRTFYNDGIPYDPYAIDNIEIWSTRYDPEYENENPGVLLKDTLFGSRVLFPIVSNSAAETLGLTSIGVQTLNLTVVEHEQEFNNVATVIVPHNMGDRYPIVTIYDLSGQMIIPDVVTSLDVNTIQVDFAIPMSGVVDVVGAIPQTQTTLATSSVLVSRYVQPFTNETIVTVTHNLNDELPTVVVYDTNYQTLMPDLVQVIDANTVKVYFSILTSGEVIVTGGQSTIGTVGFGMQAIVQGTKPELFDIHTGENDTLKIQIDNGAIQVITLPQRYRAQIGDIVADINSQLIGGKAEIYDTNKLSISSDTFGENSEVELITVTNAAYLELGLTLGTYNGLGYEPAEVATNRTAGYNIDATNNKLLLNYDGLGDVTVTLLNGLQRSAASIAAEINAACNLAYGTTGVFYAIANTVTRQLVIKFLTTSTEIKAIANSVYAEIGFTVGTYVADVVGTQAEYYLITGANDMLVLAVNYYDPLNITLAHGRRTLADIITELNVAIITASLDEAVVVEPLTGVYAGKFLVRALLNDGIKRDAVGQYYVEYDVPESFTDGGVYWKKYLDVWNYRPTSTYTQNIADDTEYFIVYPDRFFLDSGYSTYDYSFALQKDFFVKGEKRNLICDIQALPKYKTPAINDWVLPISEARYRITTYEGLEIEPWTSVDVCTGRDIRFYFDTTGVEYRDGVYKIYYELVMPNSEVIRSASQKITITSK